MRSLEEIIETNDAYYEGIVAFKKGKPRENPYPASQPQNIIQWYNGYDNATNKASF